MSRLSEELIPGPGLDSKERLCTLLAIPSNDLWSGGFAIFGEF
jgi:hypothetical protein